MQAMKSYDSFWPRVMSDFLNGAHHPMWTVSDVNSEVFNVLKKKPHIYAHILTEKRKIVLQTILRGENNMYKNRCFTGIHLPQRNFHFLFSLI